MFLSLVLGQRFKVLGFVSAVAVAFVTPVLARNQSPTFTRPHLNNDNLSAAEHYAWGKIKLGQPANFSLKCEDWSDPKQEDDPGWHDEIKSQCRTLRASFIVDILTKPPLRDSIHYKGVDIRGAKIVGDLDLAFAKIDRAVQITESRFEGDILLRNARADSILALDGSVIAGWLDATELHSNGDLRLPRTSISQAGLTLNNATIAGFIDLSGVTCMGGVQASSLYVGGSLFMGSSGENTASFKDVRLVSAKVVDVLSFIGASFDGDLNANGVQAGELYMRSNPEKQTRIQKGESERRRR